MPISDKSQGALNLYLVVGTFLKHGTRERIIGGTESYTASLIQMANRIGGRAVVFQRSHSEFDMQLDGFCRVISWSNIKELRSKLRHYRQDNRGVLVQYDGMFLPEQDELPCVVIQHGIGADGTADRPERSRWLLRLADWRRRWRFAFSPWSTLRICNSVNHVICVDTNFINYVRLSHPMFDWGDRLVYVPNFADLHPLDSIQQKWATSERGALTFLFARRFELHRGTWLWAECVRSLARQYPQASFRFVGHGIGERAIKELTSTFANVRYYARPYEEMHQEFRQAHVSVVPSLWSEGTSLSCIESMAAGCAPVVSNVGGLSNLVVPGYNGELLSPTVFEFQRAASSLLEEPGLAESYALRSYEVARRAFAREVWEQRLLQLLLPLQKSPALRPVRRRFRLI